MSLGIISAAYQDYIGIPHLSSFDVEGSDNH